MFDIGKVFGYLLADSRGNNDPLARRLSGRGVSAAPTPKPKPQPRYLPITKRGLLIAEERRKRPGRA